MSLILIVFGLTNRRNIERIPFAKKAKLSPTHPWSLLRNLKTRVLQSNQWVFFARWKCVFYAQHFMLFVIFRVNFKLLTSKFCFPMVRLQKCWFRKAREVCRKTFHLVAPLKTSMEPSYDQKTKKLTSIKVTSIKFRAYKAFSFLRFGCFVGLTCVLCVLWWGWALFWTVQLMLCLSCRTRKENTHAFNRFYSALKNAPWLPRCLVFQGVVRMALNPWHDPRFAIIMLRCYSPTTEKRTY